jgi:hypothetical protein
VNLARPRKERKFTVDFQFGVHSGQSPACAPFFRTSGSVLNAPAIHAFRAMSAFTALQTFPGPLTPENLSWLWE